MCGTKEETVGFGYKKKGVRVNIIESKERTEQNSNRETISRSLSNFYVPKVLKRKLFYDFTDFIITPMY